jgi:hypothetical protein
MINVSNKLYGLIVQFYPKRYKQEFGEEMKYVFSETLKDSYRENGDVGILGLWIRMVLDTVKSLTLQYLDLLKGGEFVKNNKDIIMQQKAFGILALGVIFVLLIPFTAMQFNLGFDWDETDFTIIAILLFSIGSAFIFLGRRFTTLKSRLIIGAILFILLAYIWAELAVGIFTNLGS